MKFQLRLLVPLLLTALSVQLEGQNENAPTFYIDSVEYDFDKVHLNMLNVDSVHVDMEPDNGAIYVYTKSMGNLISIEEVLSRHVADSFQSNALLFHINGKLIEDCKEVFIDDSFYIYVEIEDLSKVNYIDNRYSSLKIINIDLEEKEREQTIRIKG